ncbi:DNA-directed DNA polymerase, partial [Synchytrium endobioticum]
MCFLVGYGALSEDVKGYRLWDPAHRKFIISNDVEFVEELVYKDRHSDESISNLPILASNEASAETRDESKCKEGEADGVSSQVGRSPEKATENQMAPILRRSSRIASRLLPHQLVNQSGFLSTMIDDVEIPNSYREALRSPFAEDWIAAMKEQYSELLEKETWELVDAPPDSNVISGRWVFNVKRDRSGNIERLKASHLTSVRVVLTIAAIENLELYQLDIKTAFLNARLDPAITVYVEQPHGFVEIGQETKVRRRVHHSA